MITGKNIHKRYGKVEVLKGVDINIEKGEVASISGPSGSGKSTLLHILGTLDNADMGEVKMNDTLINSLSGNKLAAFRNKHIGFVFQFHHLLPEFTAWENVCIPGWLAGRKKGEVKEKAETSTNPSSYSFELLMFDTINKTDGGGLKQGKWIIRKLPGNIVIESGLYKDNKKQGCWVRHGLKGEFIDSIYYKNDMPTP